MVEVRIEHPKEQDLAGVHAIAPKLPHSS